MLTLCYHPVLCLLLYVCMVLTSSEANFCQVCSGLTFSLSRHVYRSPIPIKTSTFSSPCTLLHYFLHPPYICTFSASCCKGFNYSYLHTFAEPQQFLSPFVTQFSLAILLCSLYFSIPYAMQFNAAGEISADRMWEQGALVATWVGGNKSNFATALFHFFPLIISICTDLQHWLLNHVKICIQVLFFFFLFPKSLTGMDYVWLYTLCQCILSVSLIAVSVRLCIVVSGRGRVADVLGRTQGAWTRAGSVSCCLRLCLGWVGAVGGAATVPVTILLNLRTARCLYTCITLVCCPMMVRHFNMFLLMLLTVDTHLQLRLGDRWVYSSHRSMQAHTRYQNTYKMEELSHYMFTDHWIVIFWSNITACLWCGWILRFHISHKDDSLACH